MPHGLSSNVTEATCPLHPPVTDAHTSPTLRTHTFRLCARARGRGGARRPAPAVAAPRRDRARGAREDEARFVQFIWSVYHTQQNPMSLYTPIWLSRVCFTARAITVPARFADWDMVT